MKFDTKIAVVLRDDLLMWQKINVTAFTVSGIANAEDKIIGAPYEDGSGNKYLPMFRQPVMGFAASKEKIRTVYERALKRQLQFSIYTEELFTTYNDEDNRRAVKDVMSEELNIVGMAIYGKKNAIDKVVKGLSLHP